MHRTQAVERSQRRVARGFERGPDASKFLGPAGHALTHRLQRLIRRAGGLHYAVEIRRIEMARHEGERFQRLQQRRQHGHDVVHHGSLIAGFQSVECSNAAAAP